MRSWLVAPLVVMASIAAAVLSQDHANPPSAADRGMLTSDEYAKAVAIARSELANQHATLIRAVAYVVPGDVKDPNLAGQCRSGHLLVVSLVGQFPHIMFGTGLAGRHARQGPDHWVTVKADATTGDECLVGVSVGHFRAVPDSADLRPAL
jgi:hypothetical protein